MKTFTVLGRSFEKMGPQWSGERTVEIPGVWAFVEPVLSSGGRILEVGTVVGNHYPEYRKKADVVDLVERKPWVTNVDIEQWTGGPYDLIVSISTIEHIGRPEYGAPADPRKLIRVLQHLDSLLVEGGRLVFTWPWAYNHELDLLFWLKKIDVEVSVLKRVAAEHWEEGTVPGLIGVHYGKPLRFANALVFASYVKNGSPLVRNA